MTEGEIDSKTLKDMPERGEPVTVVDVRKAEDHAEWSVPGSVNLDAHDRRRASPTPENQERIVELNRSGELPEGDPTELEAGANRCAAG